MKRFEYSLLGKKLKTQTDIANKQHQKLDNTFEFDKRIKKEKPTLKKYNRSNVIYSSKYRFYEYYNINLKSFSYIKKKKNLFYSLKPQQESTKEKKVTVYDNASGIYMYLETYFDQYVALADNKKKKVG